MPEIAFHSFIVFALTRIPVHFTASREVDKFYKGIKRDRVGG